MTLRLAVAQAPADLDGVSARLDWLASVLPDVTGQGAQLLVLPELFACGYNISAHVQDRAEPADGQIADQMMKLAQTHAIALHYGYAESADDVIFNSAACFGPDGQRLGGHRKWMIPPGWEADVFTPGQGCTLFEYQGVTIATLICYDAEYPESFRQVAGLGAQLVLVPTALGAQWGWVADTMIPTRAYENGVFLAYANSAGCENGMDFLGRSVIAAPDGQELARAGGTPEILIADIDINRVTAAQTRLPYLRDRAHITGKASIVDRVLRG